MGGKDRDDGLGAGHGGEAVAALEPLGSVHYQPAGDHEKIRTREAIENSSSSPGPCITGRRPGEEMRLAPAVCVCARARACASVRKRACVRARARRCVRGENIAARFVPRRMCVCVGGGGVLGVV